MLSYVAVLLLFKKKYSKKNEITTLIVLGFLFMLSSALVELDSIKSIIKRKEPLPSVEYVVICLIQGIVFLAISIYKFLLAKELNYNITLISDIFNSMISSLDSFSMGIGMIFYKFTHSLWYFDTVCGIITGICIFIYGCQLFYRVYIKTRNI